VTTKCGLSLKDKIRLWVFEESAGRIFEYKEELTGGEREYHNADFHDLYSSPDVIRMINQKTK
jgi:hypothetical protein